ncbi:MAG: hypothetical protein PHD13_05440 [Methanocellales archaeon]|nr:hypothetical protein [Methanocellales archaeon]MDD3292293.1 hypothetical protein [Methanocellales archaeon]MDD5235597.1 hypothetical protein [Methanocellales archaeon]MDD5485756.1 hypothetical protein [Methanocellales archaeon]
MRHHMNKNAKISLMLVTLVAVALLTALWATTYSPHSPLLETRRGPPPPPIRDMELYYTLNTVISSINVTILIFLLVTYIGIYRKIKSEFTIGLMIFSMVLLFYALSSNPLVHQIFGFRASGLGPFAMLPNLFTCGALAILLYLSAKY